MRKKLLLFLVVILGSLLNQSCSKDDDELIEITVASKIGIPIDPVEGFIPTPVYWIKHKESTTWETISIYNLLSFEYEAGYEYVIMVRETNVKNSMTDSVRYTYISTLSKTEKESEGI